MDFPQQFNSLNRELEESHETNQKLTRQIDKLETKLIDQKIEIENLVKEKEILKLQLSTYKEDFELERRDRTNEHTKVIKLQEELKIYKTKYDDLVAYVNNKDHLLLHDPNTTLNETTNQNDFDLLSDCLQLLKQDDKNRKSDDKKNVECLRNVRKKDDKQPIKNSAYYTDHIQNINNQNNNKTVFDNPNNNDDSNDMNKKISEDLKIGEDIEFDYKGMREDAKLGIKMKYRLKQRQKEIKKVFKAPQQQYLSDLKNQQKQLQQYKQLQQQNEQQQKLLQQNLKDFSQQNQLDQQKQLQQYKQLQQQNEQQQKLLQQNLKDLSQQNQLDQQKQLKVIKGLTIPMEDLVKKYSKAMKTNEQFLLLDHSLYDITGRGANQKEEFYLNDLGFNHEDWLEKDADDENNNENDDDDDGDYDNSGLELTQKQIHLRDNYPFLANQNIKNKNSNKNNKTSPESNNQPSKHPFNHPFNQPMIHQPQYPSLNQSTYPSIHPLFQQFYLENVSDSSQPSEFYDGSKKEGREEKSKGEKTTFGFTVEDVESNNKKKDNRNNKTGVVFNDEADNDNEEDEDDDDDDEIKMIKILKYLAHKNKKKLGDILDTKNKKIDLSEYKIKINENKNNKIQRNSNLIDLDVDNDDNKHENNQKNNKINNNKNNNMCMKNNTITIENRKNDNDDNDNNNNNKNNKNNINDNNNKNNLSLEILKCPGCFKTFSTSQHLLLVQHLTACNKK